MARSRRGFGAIRRLPSERYQASYTGPDLQRHGAPHTFVTRTDAEGWLSAESKLISADAWAPPRARSAARWRGETLRDYGPDAITRRTSKGEPLKPRTLALYASLLDRVILPSLGDVPMRTIDADAVRRWYNSLDRTKKTQRAHAYALLKSLFVQALAEGRLSGGVNPCTISGGSVTHRERQVKTASPEDLALIVEALPERVQPMILLSMWCALRFGEVAELRRRDVDLTAGVLHVHRAVVRLDGVEIVDTPKSDAGIRDVAIPPHILPLITEHLAQHVGAGADALIFPHHLGTAKHWTHGMFYKVWIVARDAAGRPDLRLHDLRHTGAVLAAQSGATLAELMARLGHSTPAAAMRYQHAAEGRDALLAQRLSNLAEAGKR